MSDMLPRRPRPTWAEAKAQWDAKEEFTDSEQYRRCEIFAARYNQHLYERRSVNDPVPEGVPLNLDRQRPLIRRKDLVNMPPEEAQLVQMLKNKW